MSNKEERTFSGYVRGYCNPEITLNTSSSGFNNHDGECGGAFKRFGSDSHGGVSPHVHQPQRNVDPATGNVYGGTGRKTADGGVTSPSARDVKDLYQYLNNGKYR